MTPLRLAIVGCCGRMGRAVVRLAAADAGLRIVAAVCAEGDSNIGRDVGVVAGGEPLGVAVGPRCECACDVVVEFTRPAGLTAWATWSAQRGAAFVSGTTGLDAAAEQALRDASRQVPVVWSANMSVGVNVLLELAELAARRLGPGWDIELSETHHRGKLDAPSGTAQALLAAVCAARGMRPQEAARHGRRGECGPRPAGEIGVHALRMGSVVGEHELHLAAEGEVLTLTHRALSRDIFAAGALRAARWAAGRAAGLYTMRDVLAGA